MSGEEIDTGLALEYIAAEFLATYQARVESMEPDAPEAEGDVPQEPAETVSVSEPVSPELDSKVEALMCPEGADLLGGRALLCGHPQARPRA